MNISFDGHCGHLQSWLTESILLIMLNVWIMSVLVGSVGVLSESLKARLALCTAIDKILVFDRYTLKDKQSKFLRDIHLIELI